MRSPEPTGRPALRLVEGALDSVRYTWFCGHCAARSSTPPAPSARVCRACGLGVLLETREDVAPNPDEPFLVLDRSLLVHAVSREAERLLCTTEEAAINRPATELLTPADAEAREAASFAAAVVETMSSEEPGRTFVRPWNTFGVRMRARIGSCGPPHAALLVLESAPSGLRLVEGSEGRSSASAPAAS